MDYSRWMSLNKKIHDKKLANIRLPMTRHSGTFDLSDELAPDAGFLPELQQRLSDLATQLNDAGVRPYGKDPMVWMTELTLSAFQGLTTATHENVATQLRMGIRGFDFRIYNNSGADYAITACAAPAPSSRCSTISALFSSKRPGPVKPPAKSST